MDPSYVAAQQQIVGRSDRPLPGTGATAPTPRRGLTSSTGEVLDAAIELVTRTRNLRDGLGLYDKSATQPLSNQPAPPPPNYPYDRSEVVLELIRIANENLMVCLEHVHS